MQLVWARGLSAAARTDNRLSAAATTDLGSCRLRHCKLRKLLFRKISPGNIALVPVQTSDAQTLDQYKRRTSTNVGLVQTLDGYIYKNKRRTW